MWLASDVVVQLLQTTPIESTFLHVDLLTGARKRFSVPGACIGIEPEPQGMHFGIIQQDEQGTSFCLYKNDGTLLQSPIKEKYMYVIAWLRSSVPWMPKGINGFLSVSAEKGAYLWLYNGSEYVHTTSAFMSLPEQVILGIMVKTIGDRTLLFVAFAHKIQVYSIFLQEKQLITNLLAQHSIDNAQSLAWDRLNNNLILVTDSDSSIKVHRFDVNLQPGETVEIPCRRNLAKHPFGGIFFIDHLNNYRHYDFSQFKTVDLDLTEALPISGTFFSSHGNALAIIREAFHEIIVLSASDDPIILGKSLVVKTLLSSSLGLEILWPVRQHLQRAPLSLLLRAVMGVASAEKIGLVSVARIYAQLCIFCKPEWYPGTPVFEALAALDVGSQEFLALNPAILPLVERLISESVEVPLMDVRFRINPARSHYFLMLAVKLLDQIGGNLRVMALFGLASFRKRFALVTCLAIASIYDNWDQCPLRVSSLNGYLQTVNRILQPLYSLHGQEAISSMSVESIFTGQPSSVTELIGQLPLPLDLQSIVIPHVTAGVMHQSCRVCGLQMSEDAATARGVCFCGGQIK